MAREFRRRYCANARLATTDDVLRQFVSTATGAAPADGHEEGERTLGLSVKPLVRGSLLKIAEAAMIELSRYVKLPLALEDLVW